jgi:chromosome partitioning protein
MPPALAVAVGGQGVAMPVLTITNQKGGVGKTTTTLNLAAALRERGIRVLAVDFDPQGNLTTSCGLGDADQLGPGKTIADVLLTGAHHPVSAPVVLRDVVVPTPAGVALVPANRQLTTAERVLYTTYGREFALRDALATLASEYDVILVDSVPTMGLLAINGLAAADGVIVPVQAEFLAVHGLAQLVDNVAQVRERLNPALQIWGVVLTMVDARIKHSREIAATVRATLPGRVPVFQTHIPVDVKLKDSVRAGRSAVGYDPKGRGAQAYRELAAEVAILLPAAKEAPRPAAKEAPPKEAAPGTPAEPPISRPAGANGRNPGPMTVEVTRPPPGPPPAPPARGADLAPLLTRSPVAGACPFLGLRDDPAAHRPQACAEHRCYATGAALEVDPRQQHLLCLTEQHNTCIRFYRASLTAGTASQQPERPSVLARVRGLVKQGPRLLAARVLSGDG